MLRIVQQFLLRPISDTTSVGGMTKHALTIYREKHDISVAQMARRVDTARQTIFRIERWEQVPSLGLVAKLIKATDGEVRADDFIPKTKAA